MKHTAILPDKALSGLLADILLRHPRESVEVLTEALIVSLDELDGDPDLEGEHSEDEISTFPPFVRGALENGPGCLIADPDAGVDDDGEADTAEDSFHIPGHYLNQGAYGPGCSISDPGGSWDEGGI